MERVKGIEPSSVAWEATALPLSYTRTGSEFYPRAQQETRDREMKFSVNGEIREQAGTATLAELIAQLQLAGRRLAVERNGEIVPRSHYAQVFLAEDDRIEIVQAIGGG